MILYLCLMRNKRGIILLMLWSFFGYSYAQCDSLVQINDTTVNEISSPEQLNFLDKNYSSKLGKLVRILMQTQDSAMLSNTVDKIGQLKTNDSYCFLFTMCCRPIFVKDLNPFNSLSSIVVYYGGYHALNKYHLKGAVNTSLPFDKFAGEVYNQCRLNTPSCFACLNP